VSAEATAMGVFTGTGSTAPGTIGAGDTLTERLDAAFGKWPLPAKVVLEQEGLLSGMLTRAYSVPAGTPLTAVDPLVAAVEAEGYKRSSESKMPDSGLVMVTLTRPGETVSVSLVSPGQYLQGTLNVTRIALDPTTGRSRYAPPDDAELPDALRALAPATGELVSLSRGPNNNTAGWLVDTTPADAAAAARTLFEARGITVTSEQKSDGIANLTGSKDRMAYTVMATVDPASRRTNVTVSVMRPPSRPPGAL
jgi:hypothetical protein